MSRLKCPHQIDELIGDQYPVENDTVNLFLEIKSRSAKTFPKLLAPNKFDRLDLLCIENERFRDKLPNSVEN